MLGEKAGSVCIYRVFPPPSTSPQERLELRPSDIGMIFLTTFSNVASSPTKQASKKRVFGVLSAYLTCCIIQTSDFIGNESCRRGASETPDVASKRDRRPVVQLLVVYRGGETEREKIVRGAL